MGVVYSIRDSPPRARRHGSIAIVRIRGCDRCVNDACVPRLGVGFVRKILDLSEYQGWLCSLRRRVRVPVAESPSVRGGGRAPRGLSTHTPTSGVFSGIMRRGLNTRIPLRLCAACMSSHPSAIIPSLVSGGSCCGSADICQIRPLVHSASLQHLT